MSWSNASGGKPPNPVRLVESLSYDPGGPNLPGASCAGEDRLLRPHLRRGETRAPALDRVGDVDVIAPVEEVHLPAGPAVRRRFPGDAGHAAAMQHQQRISGAGRGELDIMDVHL